MSTDVATRPERLPQLRWWQPERVWSAPLWVHALALCIALVASMPLMRPGSAFSSDDGAYALQVAALEDGDWALRYAGSDFDPEGAFFPYINGTSIGQRHLAYDRHPLWPSLLATVGRPITVLGFHLLPLAGVVGAAVAAWLLGVRLDPRAARPAFWVVATGPVLAGGWALWAHAPAAALAGSALVAMASILERPSRVAVVALLASCAGGVLLRSEGLFVAGSIALVLAVLLRGGARVLVPALCAGAAIATLAIERAWVGAIRGVAIDGVVAPSADGSPWLGGRVSGAVHSLVQGSYVEPVSGLLGMVGVLLAVVTGSCLRRGRVDDARRGAVALVVLLLARVLIAPEEPLIGLLSAWPIAVVGLVALPRTLPKLVQACFAVTVVVVGAVLLTQYPDGGGFEWGGRLLAPVLVPVGVVAAWSITAARASLEQRDLVPRRALVALAGTTALVCTVTLASVRIRHDRLIDDVGGGRATMLTTSRALPRLAWRLGDRDWYLAEPTEVEDALARLADHDVKGLTLLMYADETPPPSALASVVGTRSFGGGDLLAYELELAGRAP